MAVRKIKASRRTRLGEVAASDGPKAKRRDIEGIAVFRQGSPTVSDSPDYRVVIQVEEGGKAPLLYLTARAVVEVAKGLMLNLPNATLAADSQLLSLCRGVINAAEQAVREAERAGAEAAANIVDADQEAKAAATAAVTQEAAAVPTATPTGTGAPAAAAPSADQPAT